MSRGLSVRLKRLEKRHRPRHAKPLIVFAVQADEATGPLIGLASLHRAVDRLYGEDDWPAFAERARAAAGGARIMVATYAPAVPAVAPAAVPRAAAPDTNPQPFPWHLAGIGREDSRYRGWWQPEGKAG